MKKHAILVISTLVNTQNIDPLLIERGFILNLVNVLTPGNSSCNYAALVFFQLFLSSDEAKVIAVQSGVIKALVSLLKTCMSLSNSLPSFSQPYLENTVRALGVLCKKTEFSDFRRDIILGDGLEILTSMLKIPSGPTRLHIITSLKVLLSEPYPIIEKDRLSLEATIERLSEIISEDKTKTIELEIEYAQEVLVSFNSIQLV